MTTDHDVDGLPCRDHRAPTPVDQPTTCACGAVTRHPAPRPKEPAR